MQKLLLIFSVLLSLNAFSENKTKREEILKILPEELATLSNEDLKTLSSKFDKKITRKKNDALFLSYNSANDVTIGLKNQKFKYLLIEVTPEMKEKTSGLFERLYSSLSQKEKRSIAAELSQPTHNAGEIITIDLAKESLRLEFSNNEKKTLKRVIMWPVGGERP